MSEQESVLKLLTVVVIVNMLIVLVVVYGIMPDPIPGPVDDIALGVGAYQLASRTGMLQQMFGLIGIVLGGDND